MIALLDLMLFPDISFSASVPYGEWYQVEKHTLPNTTLSMFLSTTLDFIFSGAFPESLFFFCGGRPGDCVRCCCGEVWVAVGANGLLVLAATWSEVLAARGGG